MKSRICLSALLTLLILGSCQKLDRDITTTVSRENVMTSFGLTGQRLAAIYGALPAGFSYVGDAMLSAATDDAEYTWETSSVQLFNTGNWDAYNSPDNIWGKYYAGIHKANDFLVSCDSVDLDFYKLDPAPAQQSVYKSKLAEINRWKYEVRFLRAFFYFQLVQSYGGVPLILTPVSLSDDYQKIKRNTLAECIQFIGNECDSAATVLPITYGDADLGRATRGAALALKSKILLYAASDLFNNPSWAGGYANAELISLTGDRKMRWKATVDASKAIIDLNVYQLDNSYSNVFSTNNFKSSEVILGRRGGASNSFEIASYPIGYDLGRSGTTPSQNLVDAYEMLDGSKFDWSNTKQAESPYSNRDPRLGFTVLANNTKFHGRPVETWTGGLDAEPIAGSTKTGYYLKKYIDESLDLSQGKTSVHTWIIFRLAEIYLNYAEALNEYDPGNADIKIYVDRVRKRQGVAMPALPAGLSQTEMRERIRNERRIELAFEGQRFWDLRRWMQAPKYLGAPIEGIKVTRAANNSFNYKKFNVENRVFQSRMYLYPVPQGELIIDKALVQNPLW